MGVGLILEKCLGVQHICHVSSVLLVVKPSKVISLI